MQIYYNIASYRQWRQTVRGRVVFVPTMGALHAGHASLVTLARQMAGADGFVVVSIFINPLQFGAGEDFSRYPRTLAADQELLASHSTDALLVPDAPDMYPNGEAEIRIVPGPMAETLEGADRPGHFAGVCTVVAKFLNIVAPTHLILGQKDFQQHVILARMIEQLNFSINLVVAPTMRETDGLAMSSRNRYLTTEERRRAPVIYRTLCWAVREAQRKPLDAAQLTENIRQRIEAADLKTRYAVICNPHTFAAVNGNIGRHDVILIAAQLGTTRLIDNMQIE